MKDCFQVFCCFRRFAMWCLMLSQSVGFGQDAGGKQSEQEQALAALISLGSFSDRGIAAILMEKDDANRRGVVGRDAPLVEEVRSHFEQREGNTYHEPVTVQLPFTLETHTPSVAIERFRTHGIIELFFVPDYKLLDSPLTTRKALVDRINELAKDGLRAIWIAVDRSTTTADKVSLASHVRRMSLEVDLAIYESLSRDERRRVGEVAIRVLPEAVADATKWGRKYKMGAMLLGEDNVAK